MTRLSHLGDVRNVEKIPARKLQCSPRSPSAELLPPPPPPPCPRPPPSTTTTTITTICCPPAPSPPFLGAVDGTGLVIWPLRERLDRHQLPRHVLLYRVRSRLQLHQRE